jgi:hypothetical protein
MASRYSAVWLPGHVLAVIACAPGCGRAGFDATRDGDLDGDDTVYASCAEARDALPGAPDGVYPIAAGVGGARVAAYCDQTTDGGGWMLVTADLVESQKARTSVTVVTSEDARGGLVMRVYANSEGCGGPDDNVHLVTFADRPPWTQIRARYTFAGGTSCWWIFGSVNVAEPSAHVDGQPIKTNLIPFESGVDAIREQQNMGGVLGHAFDGQSLRCDNDAENFWHSDRGPDERSAVVILRRDIVSGPAGLATTASCTDFGSGTTSPTWWEYREISVR